MELTSEQIRFVKGRVSKWIRFYHDLGRNPTDGDAWHSALLARLLSGKEPLDTPPPERFSYPDYNLAEGEAVEVTDIRTDTYSPAPDSPIQAQADEYLVVIDGHRAWRWITQEGALDSHGLPETGVLEYKDGTRYRFFKKHIASEAQCIHGHSFVAPEREGRFLQKINQ